MPTNNKSRQGVVLHWIVSLYKEPFLKILYIILFYFFTFFFITIPIYIAIKKDTNDLYYYILAIYDEWDLELQKIKYKYTTICPSTAKPHMCTSGDEYIFKYTVIPLFSLGIANYIFKPLINKFINTITDTYPNSIPFGLITSICCYLIFSNNNGSA